MKFKAAVVVAAAVLLATPAFAQQAQLGGLSYAKKESAQPTLRMYQVDPQKPVWGPPPRQPDSAEAIIRSTIISNRIYCARTDLAPRVRVMMCRSI